MFVMKILETSKQFVSQFYLEKPKKKRFFSGPTNKALTPPLKLSGHIFCRNLFFSSFKKSGPAFTPLLVVRPSPPS